MKHRFFGLYLAVALTVAAGSVRGQFSPASNYGSTNPSKIASGDLDGLNGPDVLTTNAGVFCEPLLNDGAGSFTPALPLLQPAMPMDAKIADFDGVNNLDYVTVTSDNEVVVHLSTGWPGFATDVYSVAANAIEVEVADFDIDGDLDIAVLSQTVVGGDITIFSNDGAGSFTQVWTDATDLSEFVRQR